ncbi:Unconventional myosin-XVIIIa [Armadillidium vulgare]|nr:Unconventional myosin-XVIIIa [Armadillidium vulgare]
MLEKTQSEGSNKLLMRQLKTQLEDAEFAKNAAIKARQSAESDFSELQSQMEEALRAKKDTEDKLARVTKEKSEVQTQLEESEEEVAEVMKKYKATVSQLSVDQVNMSEQAQLISDLEHDKQVLQDRLTELSSKVEVLEGETANIHTQRRLQMKIKELESKLDLELTTRQRLESQITRLKDQVEKLSSEIDSIRMKEMQAVDHGKKLNRQLREAKEDSSNLQQKLTDSTSRKQEIEKQYELAESEIMTLKSDLKLAFKRIEDLQQALQGDLSDSDTEMSESGSESDLSLTSFLTASASTSRSSERTSSATTTAIAAAAAAVPPPNIEQVLQETSQSGKDPDSTGHDLRIHDVVMGGASLMTSIREEDGKESYA